MTIKPPPTFNPKAIATVACVFEVAPTAEGQAPTEVHLLPSGYFRATDGRPCECAAWFIDATVAGQVIARLTAQTNDTLIDYEHQSLNAAANGQKVIAAGWFRTMRFDSGKGLYATNIAWTDEATQHIIKKEIRYISAVLTYIEDTGEVLEIISAALTNTPAIDGLDDLVALNRRLAAASKQQPQGATMTPEEIAALQTENAQLKTAKAALTTDHAALTTNVAALTTANTELVTKVAVLEAEKQATAAASEKSQCAELITAALTSGKVPPANKSYLEGLGLVALKAYLEVHANEALAVLAKQHQGGAACAADNLSKDDLAMCIKMGVTPEQYKAAKGG